MSVPVTSSGPYRPWFQRRPLVALVGTVLSFLVVTALRVGTGDDATLGLSMLYVVPVSLAGITWGRWAGLGAAVCAVALIGLWVLVEDVDLTATGWASRVLPLLLVGLLLGDASDRLHRAEQERLEHVAQDLLRRQAVELNDSLVQGMTAAKWALEAGRLEQGLEILEDTLLHGQRLVSVLIRDAGLGLGPAPRPRWSERAGEAGRPPG